MKKFYVLMLRHLLAWLPKRAFPRADTSSPSRYTSLSAYLEAQKQAEQQRLEAEEHLRSRQYHEDFVRRANETLTRLDAQLELLLTRQTNPRNIH